MCAGALLQQQEQPQQPDQLQQHLLRRITELPGPEEVSYETPSLPRSPFDTPEAPYLDEDTGAAAPAPSPALDPASLPVRIRSKQSTSASESISGKAPAQPHVPVEVDDDCEEKSSPVIAAVRPSDLRPLPALVVPAAGEGALGEQPLAAQLGQQRPLSGDVHDDAETPSAAAAAGGGSGAFEDPLLAQFQALATEIYLTRSSSLRLALQPASSSSFSGGAVLWCAFIAGRDAECTLFMRPVPPGPADINNGTSFMLGSGSRAETQQHSVPGSGWTSQHVSPSSSLAVTPSAAAGAEGGGSSNPFRPSRLSRATSGLGLANGQAGDLVCAGGSVLGVQGPSEAAQQAEHEQAEGRPSGLEEEAATAADAPSDAAAAAGAEAAPLDAAASGDPVAEAPAATPASPDSPPQLEASLLPVGTALGQQQQGAANTCSSEAPGSSCAALPEQHQSSVQEGSSSGLRCSTSFLSLDAWQQRSGGRDPGGSRLQSLSPCSGGGFLQWRGDAAAAAGQATAPQLQPPLQGSGGLSSSVPRIPSRLGPRPLAVLDLGAQCESSLATALPPGSPPAGRMLGVQLRVPSRTNLAALQTGEDGLMRTPRGSPGAGQVGGAGLQAAIWSFNNFHWSNT